MQLWHSRRGVQARMGLLHLDKRAGRQLGAPRGSSVCFSLGVSVLGFGMEGLCPHQPP